MKKKKAENIYEAVEKSDYKGVDTDFVKKTFELAKRVVELEVQLSSKVDEIKFLREYYVQHHLELKEIKSKWWYKLFNKL